MVAKKDIRSKQFIIFVLRYIILRGGEPNHKEKLVILERKCTIVGTNSSGRQDGSQDF